MDRAARLLALLIGGLVLLAVGLHLADLIAAGAQVGELVESWDIAEASIAVNFAVVGALVAAKRPRNPIGWLLLLQAWPYAGNVAPIPTLHIHAIVPLLLVLLLFPHGRLPSPRWRVLVAVILVTATVLAIGTALDVHVGGVVLWDRLEPVLIVCLPLSVAAVVVRFRRATYTERQQLRLLVLAGSFLAVSLLAGALLGVLPIVNAIAFPTVPWAIAAAVFRYRLYGVDRLISRTATYAALTVLLGSVYATIVVGTEMLLGPDDAPLFVVALATLTAAVLFRPLRSRLQILIDRRFNRSRYDAARVVSDFGSHLRTQVDLAALEAELVRVARYALHPSSASLWLIDPERST